MQPRYGSLRLRLFVVLILVVVVRILLTCISDVREEANVAYFVQVGTANIHLLPRLLHALYYPNNFYAIHFDLKIPPEQMRQSVLQIYRGLSKYSTDKAMNVPNIFIVPSEPITYRGITMTLNYFTGISFLLQKSSEWHFFVNLSAADYPTISQRLLRSLLARSPNCNFIEWKPPNDWFGFADRRLGDYYIDTALALSHRINTSQYLSLDGDPISSVERVRKPPSARNPLVQHLDYTIAKSSGWLILSREFCEHLMMDPFARKVTAALSFSDASDEHIFATLLWNDLNWRNTTIPANFRSIFFVAPNGSFAMGNDGVRSRQHPFWVDEIDIDGGFLFWDELQDSPGFFTRKVRDQSNFRDQVDSLMIGLNGPSKQLKEYEKRVEQRFQALLVRQEGTDVFGHTIEGG